MTNFTKNFNRGNCSLKIKKKYQHIVVVKKNAGGEVLINFARIGERMGFK